MSFDDARADAFGVRMLGVMNDAMLALLVSVGHRTGLFDAMSALPAARSTQIADAAGLDERYVREWLDGMTVARVVEYDAAARTYALPAEHASSLTRAAGTGNIARMTQYVGQMGSVEDEIVECFRSGGGVPYSRYPSFQSLMGEMSAQIQDKALVKRVLPLVDGITERLEAGIDVCEVGCGQGHATNLMAQRFPNSRFTGWDISEDGIDAAREESAALGLGNTAFEVKDAATIDGSQQFDFITVFDAIHDQAQPARVLSGIADALRDDGAFLCVDIGASSNVEENVDHPLGTMLYSISTFHCMTVSLAYGGTGLGAMWGHQTARQMLADAGFTKIETKTIPADIMNAYYIARKG